MSVLEKIVRWQSDLPDWQSDLIRKILGNENLEEQIQTIYQNIKIESGLEPGTSSSIRFQADGFQGMEESSTKVTIKRIHSLKNINAIRDNEELNFVPIGLTLIFGENGTGKSGYARLLKIACRSRDRIKSLHGNVYATPSSENSAVFEFRHNDSDKVCIWNNGVSPDPLLSEIAVFDSACARIIVNEKNEVEYVPYGADIFESMASFFNSLKKYNESLRSLLPKIPAELEKVSYLKPIKEAQGKLETASSSEDVISLIALSPQEEKELSDLSLIADPIKLAGARKDIEKKTSLIGRIRFVEQLIKKIEIQLSTTTVSALAKAWKNAYDAKAASQEAAKGFDSLKELKGIGSDTWKALFLAAGKYSKEFMYPDSDFPCFDDEAVCVLCHQQLDEESKRRFSQFSSYLKNEAEVLAATRKQEFLDLLSVYKSDEVEVLKNYSDVCEVVDEKSPGWKDKFDSFIVSAAHLRKDILQRVKTGDYSDFSSSELKSLSDIEWVIADIEADIKTISKFIEEGATKEKFDRLTVLSARKSASRFSEYFDNHISTRKNNSRIQAISDQLNTRKISSFASQVISEIVTEELKTRLQKEFTFFFGSQINVELKQSVQQGKISHYLSLNIPANTKVSPHEILSEGEQKVVAIASFLAEISAFGFLSGIVFDDPVSSLDHKWKIKIAKRLSEESKNRQVVVFTHDVGFAIELQRFCAENKTEIQINSLTKAGKTSGIRESEHPWPMLAVGRRIGFLKSEHQRLEKIARVEGEASYGKELARIYSLLRSSWERAIEEGMLNSAILRFRNSIETNRLKEVPIPDEDYKTILEGMTRCSEYTDAHDEAAEKGSTIPEPTELLKDIEKLEVYVQSCNKRRKDLASSRK